jgi:hypothetical protein
MAATSQFKPVPLTTEPEAELPFVVARRTTAQEVLYGSSVAALRLATPASSHWLAVLHPLAMAEPYLLAVGELQTGTPVMSKSEAVKAVVAVRAPCL